MQITDFSTTVHELTKAFSELSPLILVITAVALAAITSYKKVVAALPSKNAKGEILSD